MPKNTTKSVLSGLGAEGRKAFDSTKADKVVNSSSGELPGGIEHGVAKLVECKFGVYKTGNMEGKPFFMASGVVTFPLKHDGMSIEGLRTNIGPEPLCETPTRKRQSIADHVAWILNEMKKLGADLSEVDFDGWEMIADALKKAAPSFRFRTWKPEPAKEGPYKGKETRVIHMWGGTVEDTGPEDDGVSDQTQEDDNDIPPDSDDTIAAEPDDDNKVATLVYKADQGDTDAQKGLTDLALASGASKEDVEDDDISWQDVADMIDESGDPEPEPDPEPADDWKPAKEEIYKYTPKGKRKPVDVEITAVFKGTKTVNCKNTETNPTTLSQDTYKKVPWDKLTTDD